MNKCQFCQAQLDNKRAKKNCTTCTAALAQAHRAGTYAAVLADEWREREIAPLQDFAAEGRHLRRQGLL